MSWKIDRGRESERRMLSSRRYLKDRKVTLVDLLKLKRKKMK